MKRIVTLERSLPFQTLIMDKRIEEILDYSLLIAQAYLLIRLKISKNSYFKTPFFYFFILTGYLSVIGFILCVRIPIPEDRAWLYKFGYLINVFGVMGSTIGKMYIATHRFAVLRSVHLLENMWSIRLTAGLTGILIFFSCARCISVFFCDYAFVIRDGKKYVVMFDDQCNVADKSQSSVMYSIFIIVSVTLTILSSRQYYKIQRKADVKLDAIDGISTKSILVQQQKKMFIIVSVCTISHLIKAVHQFCWVFAAVFHLSAFNTRLQATVGSNLVHEILIEHVQYVYPHYLATYSASITLVIFFPRIRRLLISRRDVMNRSPAGDDQYSITRTPLYFAAVDLFEMPSTPIAQNKDLLEKWRSTLNNEVLKSPCANIPIPEETLIARILNSLEHHSSKYPGKAAVIEAANEDRSLTYQQVHDRALSFAAFLASRGFRIGDRLTAALPNSIEWPVMHVGTWTAGGAVVGSSAAFKLYETVYQLRDSSSSFVVVSEQLLDTFIEAAKECSTVKTIICVRSSDRPLPDGVIDFEETIKIQPLKELPPVTLDTVCMIYYSSGTTGQPKGIIHTHRTFHCAVEMLRSHWLHEIYPVLGADEVDLYKESQIVNSACYHILGFAQLNWYLITGSPMILVKAFEGKLYLDLVEKYKPRYLIVAPPIFTYLAKDAKGKMASLSSVQMIVCSTAPLSKELSDEFLTSHQNVKYIVQGYGMTEMCFSHLPLLLDVGVNASCGVIVDIDSLPPAKQGQRGEVCVRGAAQTIGYLNKTEATKELIDDDGWIHTGDIGYIDDRGLLYVVDRLKELIKVNYMNQSLQVPPAELEGILISHHRIRDAAIVGIPDASHGELVRAFVVKSDENLTEKEVENLVADKLAEFKRITGGVVFVDAIPRSPAGKILRRVLRKINGA
ncbi:hypothetical protein PRIPAC_76866 [Pristionchus pacificus]|uniref:AMP-binding protein n=1 Tax=Pristionchus pacificus TaxID=54126 RepID=A0A2A6C493_PRIPA|nr:hypothetical protein PRIPAC_76866 [Pristionchus pacificus]|eukprot:PDM72940.1 AMP-binding protein [Pristionchus pacificus]